MSEGGTFMIPSYNTNNMDRRLGDQVIQTKMKKNLTYNYILLLIMYT